MIPVVTNNVSKATDNKYNKYNLPGHGIENMKFKIIEKVKKNDETYRKERERYFIEKFNIFHAGMNKMP